MALDQFEGLVALGIALTAALAAMGLSGRRTRRDRATAPVRVDDKRRPKRR